MLNRAGRTRTLHAFTTSDYTGRMIMHVEQSRIWKETFVAYFEPLFWHTSVHNEEQSGLSSDINCSIVLQVLYFRYSHSDQWSPLWHAVSADVREVCHRHFHIHFLCFVQTQWVGPNWYPMAPQSTSRRSSSLWLWPPAITAPQNCAVCLP